MVITLLWLYVARNFAKIMGFESPEPLANLYSRSYFRATWITTALDAGFWTAMKIRPKWLKDISSIVFSLYYLIAAEQADEKVRRVRATMTVEHLRVSWNKATTPYLSLANALLRPRYMKYAPRQIRIARPRESSYREPVNAWLYFNGSLAELRSQTRIILDVPGGGYVAMTPRSADDRLLAWAGKTGVPILSLDYRKAPEFPYPYALNECFDVYRAIVASRGRCVGLDGHTRPHIVVSGDSAGGNLATGMTIMVLQSGRTDTRKWLGESPLPPPNGLILMYPSLDMNIGSWMTEEQMSLIQDRGMRKTNEGVLRRKSEDYTRLTPKDSLSFSSAHRVHQEEPALEPASPVKDYFSLRHHKESDKLGTATMDLTNNNHPTEIRTRLAVSSMISYFGDRVLTPEMMRAMIILYIGPHNRPDFKTDFLLSPVLAPDAILAAFPKTYLITGERDPLVDDTVIFAGRIRQAKLLRFRERQDLALEKSQQEFNEKDHVEVNLIPGISHGFVNFPGIFPDGWRHIHKCARWIGELFDQAAERERSQSSSKSNSRSMLLNSQQHEKLSTELQSDQRQQQQQPQSRTDENALDSSRRSSVTESSVDEDRPLEMSVSRFTPIKNTQTGNSSTAIAAVAQPSSQPSLSLANPVKRSMDEATIFANGVSTTSASLALALKSKNRNITTRSNSSSTSIKTTKPSRPKRASSLSVVGTGTSSRPLSFLPLLKTVNSSISNTPGENKRSQKTRGSDTNTHSKGEEEDVDCDDDEDDDGSKSFVSSDNGTTLTRLPSEEDLLGRRMNGLAGGLMGLGEGVRTP